MQMCPDCDCVYDESEYSRCPFCSGELSLDAGEKKARHCPNCGGVMYWEDVWFCTNCDEEIEGDEDDYEFTMV